MVDRGIALRFSAVDSENVNTALAKMTAEARQAGAAIQSAFSPTDAALDKVGAAARRTAADVGRVGQSARATRVDMTNLSHQLSDVFTGLTTGQRPLQVLLQQGPQFAHAMGGWGASLRALTNPITLAVAGVTALTVAFGALVARASGLEATSRQIGVSLRTMGGASGLSVGNVQNVIEQQIRQPGFGRTDTTAAAQQILGNRNVRGDDFKAMLELAREYALVTRSELPAAIDTLLPKLTAGAAGLRQLDEQYDILRSGQLQYIESLERQGRQQDITRIGIEAMSARFKGQGVAAMSEFSRAVDDAGKALSGTIDAWVRNDPVIKGILRTFSATAAAAREAIGPRAAPDPRAALQARVDELNRQRATASGLNLPNRGEIAMIDKQIKEAQAAINKFDGDRLVQEYMDIIAAAIGMGNAVEESRKKLDTLLDRLDPARVEIRNVASELTGLGDQLRKVFNPEQAQRTVAEFTARLDPFVKKLRELQDAADDAGTATTVSRTTNEVNRRYQRIAAGTGATDEYGGITDPQIDIQRRLELAARGKANDKALGLETDQALFAANLEKSRAAAIGNARALAELSAQQAIYNVLLKFGDDEQVRAFITTGTLAEKFKEIAAALREAAQAGVTGQIEERFKQFDKEVKSLSDVTEAYLKSTAAGREADIMHRAWMETTSDSADETIRLAQALDAVDQAQRRVEGAKLIAQTRDDARNERMMTDALRESVDAYDKATIAVKVLREVEAGRFQAGSREAEAYRRALEDVQLQQTRQQAIQFNRQFDPQAQFRHDIQELDKLARTGELSARAYQGAWTEAYIRSAQASDSWVDGATAGLLEYARTAQQVGRSIADVFQRAFTAIEDALLGLGTNWSKIWQDMQRISIRQNITGPLAQLLGGASLSAQGNGGGSSGGSGALGDLVGLISRLVSSSSGGSGQTFFSSGAVGSDTSSWVSSIFSGSGLGGSSGGGSSGSWIQSLLGGLGGGGGGGGSNPLSSIFSMFGGSGGGSQQLMGGGGFGMLGGAMGNGVGSSGGLGGLMGGGASGMGMSMGGMFMGGFGAISGIMNAMNSKTTLGKVGGGLQAAGSIISMIPTPWTKAIGLGLQIIGSILPMFAPKPNVTSASMHDFNTTTGKFGARLGFAEGVDPPMVPEIGNSALTLMKQFGGTPMAGAAMPSYYVWKGHQGGEMNFDAGPAGTYYQKLFDKYKAMYPGEPTDRLQYMARREIWNPDDSTTANMAIEGPTQDFDTLAKQTTVLIMKAMVKSGSIEGLSDTSQKIIRGFMEADPDKLGESMQWGKDTYDVLRREHITEAEKAFTDMQDTFKAAIEKAKELSLATDELVASQSRALNKYAQDFNQNVGDRILGINDPAALQRVQLDREFDLLRKEAAYLNEQYAKGLTSTLVDINELERAYGLERARIVSQQMADLVALQQRLLFGDLSGATPATAVAGAQASFQATLAQAMAGSGDALGNLSQIGGAYVESLQAAYGHTERFVRGRDEVLAAIEALTGADDTSSTGSMTAANDADNAWQVIAQQAVRDKADLQTKFNQLTQQVALLIAELQRRAA